ncbi:MAG: dicarboxylate/amino acid:cation symporter [Bacteroidaceae bacterium]|nr:dicarboxylate/amino acid:cation symporter [Bacteroidaceae bacterium]
MKRISFTTQIFLALILAIIAGYLLQGNAEFTIQYIRPFGDIFLNLLKFIVVPLVMFSIICGIISMRDTSQIGHIAVRTLLYFAVTTIFASCLGLMVSSVLRPWFPPIQIPFDTSSLPDPAQFSFMDQLINMVPSNMIEPLATTTMIQVIVMALLLGIAIAHCGQRARLLVDLMRELNEIVTQILSYIMLLTPMGVFCMLTPVVAVNGPSILGSYAVLVGTDYFCFFLHILIVYVPCVWLLARMNPLRFLRGMFPAMLFAFSSDSSVATLPVTMRCTERLGVPRDIGNFILSLGATINMDGVAIYLGVTAVFIANCCGIDLSMSQYSAIAISATIASIGTPGIPGGSLALMAMVFASSGIPVEGVAIAAGVDRIVDMARTTMSITGDASCAVVVNRMVEHT